MGSSAQTLRRGQEAGSSHLRRREEVRHNSTPGPAVDDIDTDATSSPFVASGVGKGAVRHENTAVEKYSCAHDTTRKSTRATHHASLCEYQPSSHKASVYVY